jgi:hypothetical protein
MTAAGARQMRRSSPASKSPGVNRARIAAGAAPPAHARAIHRHVAPQTQRRVSGPLRGGPTTIPRSLRRGAPSPPRTIRLPSLPAGGRIGLEPLYRRTLAFVKSLPDHPLLDRIVRGRTWIVLLGVLLSGIVAMQVEMLKLGASMGRSIQLGSALQSRNELLRASVSALSDDRRIERLASGMGMVMPGPTTIGFLDAARINLGRAEANTHAPDPSGFLAALPSNQVDTTGTGTNALPAGASGSPDPAARTGSALGSGAATVSGSPPTSTMGSGPAAATGGGTPTAATGTPAAGLPGTATGIGTSGTGPPAAGASAGATATAGSPPAGRSPAGG